MVPAGAQLFATPELDHGALMVMAYRLDRDIARKLITCAGANEYFLSSFEEREDAGVKTLSLASSAGDKIALVTCSRTNPQDPSTRSPRIPLTEGN